MKLQKFFHQNEKISIAYITSSPFSGSTLLAFILNSHPEISTVSEMTGFESKKGASFRCSCGKFLKECPFFLYVAKNFHKNNLRFDFKDFDTDYVFFNKYRLNRLLFVSLNNDFIENLRDKLLLKIFSKFFKRKDLANYLFISSALSYFNAKVFVDGSKSPYRLRHLKRIPNLDLKPIYIIRDFHGVVLSNIERLREENKEESTEDATKKWIKDQLEILRILQGFSYIKVYYEDICDNPNKSLAKIYKFINLKPCKIPKNLKSVEHHILGNDMRDSSSITITKSERWKSELQGRDLNKVNALALEFVKKNKNHPLSEIIKHYLNK